jgi:type IV secretory pathway TraG/TraD family ATPase VirD4
MQLPHFFTYYIRILTYPKFPRRLRAEIYCYLPVYQSLNQIMQVGGKVGAGREVRNCIIDGFINSGV